MMAMIEPAFILLDAFNTHLKALSRKGICISTSRFAVHSLHDEGPVHHLIAIEQMACKDQLENVALGKVLVSAV
jgi:hypothetical protein